MNVTTPKVYLIAATKLAGDSQIVNPLTPVARPVELEYAPLPADYEQSIGLSKPWTTDAPSDGEALIEAAGRICYKSWEPGINSNVTKIRTGNELYLGNVLEQRHGSIMEHVSITFLFHHVSRVFTHELVRHRVGVAISQESLRYVRIDENTPMVLPPEIADYVMNQVMAVSTYTKEWTAKLGDMLDEISSKWAIDKPGTTFNTKKRITSALRRFIGMGVATDMVWTANIRTLRHCLEMRTDAPGVEWEMLEVFGKVGEICKATYPNLFQDFVRLKDGSWCTYHRARALQCLQPPLSVDGTTDGPCIVQDEYKDRVLMADSSDERIMVPRSWVKSWADRMKGNP